jgi:hypothetical protein
VTTAGWLRLRKSQTMTRPVLVSPTDNISFFYDEIIRFEWDTDAALAAPIKFDLYIGQDPHKPYEDPGAIRKRWFFTPGNAWTSFNESAEVLGLQPGETYYWQVVREEPGHGMAHFSDVRSFHIKPIHSRPPLGFHIRVFHGKRIRSGLPFKVTFQLANDSTETVRLNYTTEKHFVVEIYATRGILPDKYVWPRRGPLTKQPHYIEIAAGQTQVEEVIWDQRDINGRRVINGRYRAVIYSLAVEYKSKTAREIVIT